MTQTPNGKEVRELLDSAFNAHCEALRDLMLEERDCYQECRSQQGLSLARIYASLDGAASIMKNTYEALLNHPSIISALTAQPVPQAAGVDVVKHATALVILINKCPLLFEFGDTSKREKISRKVKQLENALAPLPSEPVLSEQAALGVIDLPYSTELSDKRVERFMEEFGYPNSTSLFRMLKQYENQIRHEIEAALQNAASQGGK